MTKEKSKIVTSKDDYDKALATETPTEISQKELQDMAKEAVKKFKSLS